MPPTPIPASKNASTENARTLIDSGKWLVLLAAAGLVLLVGAAYFNTLHVPFLLDDADSIEKNPTIRSLTTAFFPPTNSGITVSGRPLLNFTLAINYLLGGTSLAGYHIGNLAIHALGCLALFGVVRRTLLLPSLRERFGRDAVRLAWFSAALWALHPMQTESVTYIIQRAESLVGLCYLFTLYAFIRSVEAPSRAWTAVAILSCLLGMTAKEVMATAPLIVLLYDRTFVSGTFAESWRLRSKFYLALASGWIILLLLIVSSGGRGKSVGYNLVTAGDYLLTQAPGICGYLWHAVWPMNLVFDYGAIVEKTPGTLIPAAIAIFTVAVLTAYAVVKRPQLGFLAAWILVILAPTSSFVPVATQTLAEHRMYLPLASLAVAVVLVIHQLRLRTVARAILALLVIATGMLAHTRNQVFQSPISLWEDTVRKIPDNIRAQTNLGYYYLQDNKLEKALSCYSAAAKLNPNAPMLNDVALVLLKLNRHTDALPIVEQAAALQPNNVRSHVLLGEALIASNRTAEGMSALQKAIQLQPNNAEAHLDLANVLAKEERLEEAAAHYEQSLKAFPANPEALTDYGILLRTMHRLPESTEKLLQALALDPKQARIHSNLGVTLLQSGQTEEAIRELEETIALDPSNQQALYQLATHFSESGQTEKAIKHFEALIRLASPTAEILNNLGVLYAHAGRLNESVSTLEKALQLDPNHQASKENLEKVKAFLKASQSP